MLRMRTEGSWKRKNSLISFSKYIDSRPQVESNRIFRKVFPTELLHTPERLCTMQMRFRGACAGFSAGLSGKHR